MKLNRHILVLAAMIPTLIGCSSGSDDDSNLYRLTAEECELAIVVDAGQTYTEASRADADQPWADPYPEEDGTAMENRVESILIYFITPSGEALSMTPTDASGSNGRYEYRVKVSVNKPYITRCDDGDYSISGRIVTVANCPGGAPANPLDIASYSIDYISNNGCIPMWGVTTVDGLRLRVNHTTKAGTIKLLRSVAKVTIGLDEEAASLFKITAVKANQSGYLSRAFCQPAGAGAAATTEALMREGCFNPAADSGDAALSFRGLGSSQVWCYPAEREAGLTAAGDPLSLDVTLERIDGTGASFTGRVYLCDYAAGAPSYSTAFPALVRNHDYRYVISLSELQFIISFKEWIFGGKVHLELE